MKKPAKYLIYSNLSGGTAHGKWQKWTFVGSGLSPGYKHNRKLNTLRRTYSNKLKYILGPGVCLSLYIIHYMYVSKGGCIVFLWFLLVGLQNVHNFVISSFFIKAYMYIFIYKWEFAWQDLPSILPVACQSPLKDLQQRSNFTSILLAKRYLTIRIFNINEYAYI